ncbi:hypothetical protein KCTC52924_02002 [Arenibacter antarcticus]|uniref:Uncharacterized protein n=1 Tax=Arenibacter antarcticus TaxID=2040469 RepID=A0ABW5VED1_9FLAO|nr:hypothetical protein [Arenibacter sp. H213]MCM4168430.1 hypothetical protein [Arenibacter sp. H213]
MNNLGLNDYSELIDKLLIFLKEHKVSQNRVSSRINYYSLSKAKNIARYPQKIIEGKSRSEVFNKILAEYGLKYDKDNETFTSTGLDFTQEIQKVETTYYVLYYFSYAKQIVGKGLVTIKEKKWATIDFNDPNHTSSLWKGTFDVVESYSFLYLEKKGDTTPVRAFYSFFSGTIKHGRPILIGTYSTIKRDGSPTAGNVIMEKAESKEEAIKTINGTTNPKATAFLLNKNFTIETITPPTLDDLPKLLLSKTLVGEYVFYWPYKNGRILNGKLVILETSEIEATFEKKSFNGSATLADSNTLHIKLRNSRINRNLKSNNVHAYLNINNYNKDKGVISGLFLTPSLLTIPASFPILLVKKDKEISEEAIARFFDSYTAPLFTAVEPIELLTILQE